MFEYKMEELNMKKMRSLLVAGVLTLSVAGPAFAADIEAPEAGEGTLVETIDGGVEGKSVVSEAEFKLPEIKVTLPTTHGFIVNPYNLENAGQIVSSTATIKNESNVAVDVYLKSATAAIEGPEKKLAVLGLVTDKITTKTVELNLNVAADADKGTVVAAKTNITGKNTNVKLVSLPKETGLATLEYDGKVVANPVGNPWTDADKITVTSVYTFTPAVVTE